MKDTQICVRRYGRTLLVLLVVLLCFCTRTRVDAATNETGTVTATSLNVRKSAKVTSDSLGKLQKGTQVTILGSKKDTNGDVWYKIESLISEKTVKGYVSSAYVKKNKVYSYVQRIGKTNATMLNIRKSTSTNSEILAKVPKGTIVTVIGETTVSKTKWVKLTLSYGGKKVTGYTHSTYITKDAITTETDQYGFGYSNADNVAVYKKANTYTDLRAQLMKKQEVVILGSLQVGKESWYKVKIKMNASTVFGYVKATSIVTQKATVSATQSMKATVTKKTNAHKTATTVAKKIVSVPKKTPVTVRGTLTVNGTKWYRIKFKLSGSSYDAYMKAESVLLDEEAAFEESIKGFPESYKSQLRLLHEQYPKWSFVPLFTGLDFETVIENESKAGRNTIQSNVPKGGSVTAYSAPFSYLSTVSGAYNWSNDTYTLMDGSNWYTASPEVIRYYMDPRNNLTPEKIWQFEALAYDEKQSVDVVSKILAGTFMEGDYSCYDKTTQKTEKGNYAKTFMEAGKLSGASPYFLALRAKQELGIKGSNSVSGTYPGYEGIYNFYNIGANDSSTGQAIANGLRWASSGTTYMRPWTSIYKAMVGGASYISTSYINKGQNTLYLQKFNVVYQPFYSHQYMTNVMAPTSEARSQYNSYNSLGILNGNYVFYIPVYENMPAKAATLPEAKGNPNSYVKYLTAVYGNKSFSLTPTFNYMTTTYTMVVPNDVESILIDGAPISKYGTISGLGSYELKEGKTTTITIKCTAQNGTTTNYTLKVSRLP